MLQYADLILIHPILLCEHIFIHGISNWLPHMLHTLHSHLGWLPGVMRHSAELVYLRLFTQGYKVCKVGWLYQT